MSTSSKPVNLLPEPEQYSHSYLLSHSHWDLSIGFYSLWTKHAIFSLYFSETFLVCVHVCICAWVSDLGHTELCTQGYSWQYLDFFMVLEIKSGLAAGKTSTFPLYHLSSPPPSFSFDIMHTYTLRSGWWTNGDGQLHFTYLLTIFSKLLKLLLERGVHTHFFFSFSHLSSDWGWVKRKRAHFLLKLWSEYIISWLWLPDYYIHSLLIIFGFDFIWSIELDISTRSRIRDFPSEGILRTWFPLIWWFICLLRSCHTCCSWWEETMW